MYIMNIFLIGTCRIHRPFGCDNEDKKPVNSEYKQTYNTLNLWGSYNFLGPKYNIKEIYQFLNLLTCNENSKLLNVLCKNTEVSKKFSKIVILTKILEVKLKIRMKNFCCLR